MKLLVLANGFELNVTDVSSISYLEALLPNFANVDMVSEQFVPVNFKTVTLDGVVYTDVVPLTLSANLEIPNVKVVMTTRMPSKEELVDEQLSELQDAVVELAELIAGGE